MSDRDIDQQRIYVLLRLFFGLCLAVHTILLALFVYLRIEVLWIFNIFSCCLFVFAFYLLKKNKFFFSLQLAILEILLHSTVASYMLGWASYFGLYFIAVTIIIVNSFTLKLVGKAVEVTLVSLLLVALFVLTGRGYRVVAINPLILDAIGLFNIVTVLFTVLFMSFRNFIENERLKKRFEEMSELDMLTGVYNRRFFNKYLDIEIRRNASQIKYALQKEANFGIAMIDIDDFKRINDDYGHLTGDKVLADIVRVIKTALFERDILCRYGGEEFVALFTSTPREGAILAIEKIRKIVEEHPFNPGDDAPSIRITVSIGFAGFDEETDVYGILNLADKRLYEAKRAGKNKVVFDENYIAVAD